MTALRADGAASLAMAGGDPFKNARELCERVVIVSGGEDEFESKGRGWRSASPEGGQRVHVVRRRRRPCSTEPRASPPAGDGCFRVASSRRGRKCASSSPSHERPAFRRACDEALRNTSYGCAAHTLGELCLHPLARGLGRLHGRAKLCISRGFSASEAIFVP